MHSLEFKSLISPKILSFAVPLLHSRPQKCRVWLELHPRTLTLPRSFSLSFLFFSCRHFFLFAPLSECCFRVSNPGLINKLKGESSIIFWLFNNLIKRKETNTKLPDFWKHYFFLPTQTKYHLQYPFLSHPPVFFQMLSWPVLFSLSWNNRWKQICMNIFHLVSQTIMRNFGYIQTSIFSPARPVLPTICDT